MRSERSMRMGRSGEAWSRSMAVMSRKMQNFRGMASNATPDEVRSALEFTDDERQDADDRPGD